MIDNLSKFENILFFILENFIILKFINSSIEFIYNNIFINNFFISFISLGWFLIIINNFAIITKNLFLLFFLNKIFNMYIIYSFFITFNYINF